jgi:uncharacterized protein
MCFYTAPRACQDRGVRAAAEGLVAVHNLRLSCSKAEKNANIHTSSGAISGSLNLAYNKTNTHETWLDKAKWEMKMKAAIRVALCFFLIPLAAIVPAKAGQLRDGLAAFKRHNYQTAGILLQRPAAQGVPRAQTVLCFMYSYGQGVPQNYREAADWCRRAADQGNPEGQYLLGLMYNKGQGVPEDFFEAYKWLNLAAARVSGDRSDYFYRIRNSVATKMTPDQIDDAQRIALEWTPTFEQKNKRYR